MKMSNYQKLLAICFFLVIVGFIIIISTSYTKIGYGVTGVGVISGIIGTLMILRK